jgi:hypothetical protein
MSHAPKAASEIDAPLSGEIEEAKRIRGGWVYRIAGKFGSNDGIPPEAIVGAWKVDAEGKIRVTFIKNQRYDPERWPPK